ncbi:hypothetical protein ACFLUV_02180 [Elusimicrobiota bacterium]
MLFSGGAYQMRRMDYENFHDVCITTQVVKSLTGYNNPVVCAELQTGIMRDKPRLYASDVELNLKTSMASGVDGVNCYMFSGGENPENIGIFGKMHRWQAPVSPEGDTDDKFEIIKEHGEFIKTFEKNLALAKPLFQTAFGIYAPYYGTEFLSKADSEALVYARDRYFFDGIGRLLNLGSTNFSILDLDKDKLDPGKTDTLCVFSLSFMNGDMQDKLLDYVRNGGKLMLFPELPEKELSGKSCTRLIDGLGIKLIDKISGSIAYFGNEECFVDGEVSIIEGGSDSAVIATIDDKVCALSKKVEKGKVVFVGCPVSHYYDYQIDIINNVVKKHLNIRNRIEIFPKDIIGIIRGGSAGSFLFLNNYHDVKSQVNIKVNIPELNINLNEENIWLSPRSGKILPINIKLKDNLEILFSTAEVLSYSEDGDSVKVKVKGCEGEQVKLNLNINGKNTEVLHVLKENIEEVEF